jgi:hypothetical protein
MESFTSKESFFSRVSTAKTVSRTASVSADGTESFGSGGFTDGSESFTATESFTTTESSGITTPPGESFPEELALDVSSQATSRSTTMQTGKSLFSTDVPFFIMINLANPKPTALAVLRRPDAFVHELQDNVARIGVHHHVEG